MSKMTRKYCSSHTDIPTIPHYAIVETGIHCTPGDERSRTNPGHGYPESRDPYVQYQSFLDEDEWAEEVGKKTKRGDKFSAFRVLPATISTTVQVKIDL